MTNVKIHKSWIPYIEDEFKKDYFKKLINFVKKEYSITKVYPEEKNILRAFDLCPFEDIKVVILGQDPYHGDRQANGLCFSVNEKTRKPPSLKNIYKEIESDLQIKMPNHGNLENWAKQGVLLLNATLTVRANKAGSHQKKGWEEFTDAVIKIISEKKDNIVFLLWGNYAKKKGEIINKNKHFILEAPHPSPLSAHSGFFGCKHFSKTNEYLKNIGKIPINWDNL